MIKIRNLLWIVLSAAVVIVSANSAFALVSESAQKKMEDAEQKFIDMSVKLEEISKVSAEDINSNPNKRVLSESRRAMASLGKHNVKAFNWMKDYMERIEKSSSEFDVRYDLHYLDVQYEGFIYRHGVFMEYYNNFNRLLNQRKQSWGDWFSEVRAGVYSKDSPNNYGRPKSSSGGKLTKEGIDKGVGGTMDFVKGVGEFYKAIPK